MYTRAHSRSSVRAKIHPSTRATRPSAKSPATRSRKIRTASSSPKASVPSTSSGKRARRGSPDCARPARVRGSGRPRRAPRVVAEKLGQARGRSPASRAFPSTAGTLEHQHRAAGVERGEGAAGRGGRSQPPAALAARCSARRSVSATIVNVGFATPTVGNTSLRRGTGCRARRRGPDRLRPRSPPRPCASSPCGGSRRRQSATAARDRA